MIRPVSLHGTKGRVDSRFLSAFSSVRFVSVLSSVPAKDPAQDEPAQYPAPDLPDFNPRGQTIVSLLRLRDQHKRLSEIGATYATWKEQLAELKQVADDVNNNPGTFPDETERKEAMRVIGGLARKIAAAVDAARRQEEASSPEAIAARAAATEQMQRQQQHSQQRQAMLERQQAAKSAAKAEVPAAPAAETEEGMLGKSEASAEVAAAVAARTQEAMPENSQAIAEDGAPLAAETEELMPEYSGGKGKGKGKAKRKAKGKGKGKGEDVVVSSPGSSPSYDKMTYKELQSLCKQQGIKANGKKAVLVEKLEHWHASKKIDDF
eukprot:gnl/MRDRNA2_/MRDRNA2_56607_c0_seq1.p1 gnl/MRDRNA2_/MRDRNA2_56607_c0~~gnl/MRDRNA2_/MRDRNA2_56607_c0_seq1.p1  ORF type:complete len:376 (-),score=84.88 gnl/MRDRNA2_/MRDRNA2_56607_c0_seq1:191-1156(-)